GGSILFTALVVLLTERPEAVVWQLVVFNRVITVLVCLLSGLVGLEFFKVLSRTRSIYDELQHTTSLLELASRAGRLGGWIVELGSQGIKWTEETARIH